MRIFNARSPLPCVTVLLVYYKLVCVSYNLFLLVESVLQQLSVFNASEDNGEMKLYVLHAVCFYVFFFVL